ncbi:MAG: hypothetical protein WD119_01805 [Pirellulaceae bacterium]
MHRIIKIGGSLLMRRDLPATMTAWLTKQTPAEQTSVMIGGGETIDAMRRLDAIHGLRTADMHWRCIRLLRATFEIARELFPEWRTIETRAAFDAYQGSMANDGIYLIAADAFFLPAAEPRLPETWATTSDAIAAHLCQRLAADELVLLKSCAIPENAPLATLLTAQIIDEAMLPLASEIPRLRIEQLG